MGRSPLVCAALLAACGDGDGVAVEVEVGAGGAETVEVFLGVSTAAADPSMCPGEDGCTIQPPATSGMPMGRYHGGKGWLSKGAKALRAKVDGNGQARFSVESNDGGDHLVPAMLVVGLDGNEQPVSSAMIHDLGVSGSDPTMVRIALAPARFITAPERDVDRIQIWRRPGDTLREASACAVVQHVGDTTGDATDFFVPDDDTDCDGALPGDQSPAPECRTQTAWNHCGVVPPNVDAASCIKQIDAGMSVNPPCRFGGPQCVDAGAACTSPGLPCELTGETACVPWQVCEFSSTNANPFCELGECAKAAVFSSANQLMAPSVICTIEYDGSVDNPCGGAWPTVSSGDEVQVGASCTNLELATLTPPIERGNKVAGDLDPTSAFAVSLEGSGCTREVRISGGPPSPEPEPLLIGVVTGAPLYQRRYVALKLALKAHNTGQCGTARSACTYSGPAGDTYSCH